MNSQLMNKEVLCIIDTRQIQKYLFGSSVFVDTVGGSDIMDHILQDAINFALHNIDTPLNEDEYDISMEFDVPIPYFENEKVKFQQIVCAAGNAMFIIRTGAFAQKIIRKISRYYLDHTYALNIAVAVVEKTDNFDTDKFYLYQKLNAVKVSSSTQKTLGALPVVMKDKNTGDPVTDFLDGEYLSKATFLKRQALKQVTMTANPESINTTNNYWAVIHADGNDLGLGISRVLKKVTTDYQKSILIRRKLNFNIKQNYDEIVSNTVRDLKNFYINTGNDEKNFINEFQPLHIGGDDINIICNAKFAFPFLHYFYKNLKGRYLWNSEELKVPLYACAGVAIVTRDFNFHEAYELAEHCCKNAKTLAKKSYNLRDGFAGNWIDFQISDNLQAQNFDILREKIYTTQDGINLFLRPYCLDEAAKDEIFSYRKFIEKVKLIKNLPLNQSQKLILRESYSVGKGEFNHWLNSCGIDLENILDAPLYRDAEKNLHATWFDATEIANFIPAELEAI